MSFKSVLDYLRTRGEAAPLRDIRLALGMSTQQVVDAIKRLRARGDLVSEGTIGRMTYRAVASTPAQRERARQEERQEERARRERKRDLLRASGHYVGRGQYARKPAAQQPTLAVRKPIAPPAFRGERETVEQFMARGGHIERLDPGACSARGHLIELF